MDFKVWPVEIAELERFAPLLHFEKKRKQKNINLMTILNILLILGII